MKRVGKVLRYQLSDTGRSIAIFYIVIGAILAAGLLLPLFTPNLSVQLDGLKIATTIFLLVAGLNSFKTGFLFMQANGVTRRQFYFAGMLGLAAVTVFMTVADAVLYSTLGLFTDIQNGLSPQIYPGAGFAGYFLWTLAINLLAAAFGWFVTMLYYRSGKPLKIAISLSPAVLLTALPLLDSATSWGLLPAIVNAFRCVMGLAGTPNAYVGALSMLIASAAFMGLCFLLIRRAPTKEQER